MMVHQPESAATLVALQSVSQCYPGRQGMVKVLDEVSLSVCQGISSPLLVNLVQARALC